MAGKTLEMQLADLEAKTDKTPEQLNAVKILKEKIAKKNKPKEQKPKEGEKPTENNKPTETPNEKPKPKEVEEGENDFQDYQRLGELKFLQWDIIKKSYEKKQLKAEAYKEFEKLDARFKDYEGKKPKFDKTVFVGVGTANVRLVKDRGVPKSLYYQLSPEQKEYYF